MLQSETHKGMHAFLPTNIYLLWCHTVLVLDHTVHSHKDQSFGTESAYTVYPIELQVHMLQVIDWQVILQHRSENANEISKDKLFLCQLECIANVMVVGRQNL